MHYVREEVRCGWEAAGGRTGSSSLWKGMKQRPEELDVRMRNEICKGPEVQKGLEHAWEQE